MLKLNERRSRLRGKKQSLMMMSDEESFAAWMQERCEEPTDDERLLEGTFVDGYLIESVKGGTERWDRLGLTLPAQHPPKISGELAQTAKTEV